MSAVAEPGEQLFLLDDSALAKIDRSKPVFESTGERFERDHPDLFKLSITMLAERVPIREIARKLHASQNTIRAVAMYQRIPIDAQRQVIIDSAMFAQRLAVDRITERLQAESAPSLKDSAVAFGILTQNVQLLSGGATVRLERMESSEDIYAGFERLHARLVESLQIGLVPGNPRANGRPGDLGAGSLAGPVIDAESEAVTEESDRLATESAADCRPDRASDGSPAAAPDGGEGVARAAAPGLKLTDYPADNFSDKGEDGS